MIPPGPPPRQTPGGPVSRVRADQVPAVEGGSDPAAGGQDGARSAPQPGPTVPYHQKRRFERAGENPPPPPAVYRPDPPPPPPPPPPPGPDRFSRGFPSWPPPRRPVSPENANLGARPVGGLARLFRRWWSAEPAAGVAGEQVPAAKTPMSILAGAAADARERLETGRLPSRLQALEAVAQAGRQYLNGPAQPRTDKQRVDDLARLLNLSAALQLLDAVEAHDRELVIEALAAQP